VLSASQLDLFDWASPDVPQRTRQTSEECPEGPEPTVDCPVGCRGTTACLCGQGELSDDPVWIEND
jgi:hypothetical protein